MRAEQTADTQQVWSRTTVRICIGGDVRWREGLYCTAVTGVVLYCTAVTAGRGRDTIDTQVTRNNTRQRDAMAPEARAAAQVWSVECTPGHALQTLVRHFLLTHHMDTHAQNKHIERKPEEQEEEREEEREEDRNRD